jgi:hypothetical protein
MHPPFVRSDDARQYGQFKRNTAGYEILPSLKTARAQKGGKYAPPVAITITRSRGLRGFNRKAQSQALMKIFLLYIQKSNNQATAKTERAEKRSPKEPSFAAIGAENTPTILPTGMMLINR